MINVLVFSRAERLFSSSDEATPLFSSSLTPKHLNHQTPELFLINLQMFTAWGSQTPFRQIGHKGTTKNAHTQVKRELL